MRPRESRGHDYAGVSALLVVASTIMFQITRGVWFDHMQYGEKALFWANVAVAAGTLALAAVTLWNVRHYRFADRLNYESVIIKCDDIFENPYETQYAGPNLEKYRWKQPHSLGIPKWEKERFD